MKVNLYCNWLVLMVFVIKGDMKEYSVEGRESHSAGGNSRSSSLKHFIRDEIYRIEVVKQILVIFLKTKMLLEYSKLETN